MRAPRHLLVAVAVTCVSPGDLPVARVILAPLGVPTVWSHPEVSFVFRSFVVVVGSFVLWVLLAGGLSELVLPRIFPGDFVTGRVPSNAVLMASAALFAAISIPCAWLCARFAPARPARHVLWFLILAEVIGADALFIDLNNPWTSGGEGWPRWYSVARLLTWPATCWIGLLLARRSAGQAV